MLLQKIKAFNLIELLVVIGLVSILAGIGYPSYSRLKAQSWRSEAHASLVALEAEIERKMLEEGLDVSSLNIADFNTGLTPNAYYTTSITINSNIYILSATATSTRDPLCQVIFIENYERKSINDNGVEADASTTQCW